MASDQALESRWCRSHPDRQAVERCDECGRAACLACAVPVRGQVLCTECARRLVGDPATPPAPAPSPASRIPDAAASILLAIALLATFLPWHRFGTLTAPLSAWRVRPDPWPFLAGLLLFGAAGTVAMVVLRRWPPLLRHSAIVYTVLAAAAAVAVGVALLRSPDFASHTPAPYVALFGALGAATVGAVRLRRAP